MKYVLLALLLLGLAMPVAFGQKAIRDDAIRYQQERMVFKQWDRNKFVPEPGFLYLNPMYWLTWGLHPNYPKTDLRPLSPYGPQTQRLGLVLAMQQSSNSYKLHADTLRNTALTETSNYIGAVSGLDPLWMLYYSKEFDPLTGQNDGALLSGLEIKEREYLQSTGLVNWYLEESLAIRERLAALRTANMDRGSRILGYHRILGEYRTLRASWEAKRQRSKLYLSLAETAEKARKPNAQATSAGEQNDKLIADRILSNSKL
ncbi:hypothetical protein DU508_21675 [Pedobacter chinensis]|uniref:TolC family protein n=1 Tax=Pedobacter chinensis TaxID=2282421 RepID=A0A369PP69_9SPHI|nr:hypothetical protein [Pedobacter chinensis]RDC54334.1 hypothetical protein DU508_21675 [Pedobacter chinensis]